MAEPGELETMRPNPVWDEAGYEDAIEVFSEMADEIVVKVWCGDWCPDCRSLLPDFGAALEAADVPEEQIEHFPVEKLDDGSKVGPAVDRYGIERIPTVVIETAGTEVARFVESETVPIVVHLANELSDRS